MFNDRDLLLQNPTAKLLCKRYAEKMPIIDFYSKLSPKDIAEDKHFSNIGELFVSADQDKLRAMRECGVDEKYITGDSSDYEKFRAFCSCMPSLVGNPVYYASHLELCDAFCCNYIINEKNCDVIWNHTAESIEKTHLSARSLIEKFNVNYILTAVDPADSLAYHEKLSKEDLAFKVFPSFAPDKLFDLNDKNYKAYIDRLSSRANIKITDLRSLKAALSSIISSFAALGCVTAMHKLDSSITFVTPNEYTANEIFTSALSQNKKHDKFDQKEMSLFACQLMRYLSEEYKKHDFVLQLHIGEPWYQNKNTLSSLVKNKCTDLSASHSRITDRAALLSYLDDADILPRTILYSSNSADNAPLAAISSAFSRQTSRPPYVTYGAARDACNTYHGIKDHLISYAEHIPLGGCIGFSADSSSLLAFSRHTCFRRVLCNIIGEWMDTEYIPNDLALAEKLIADISYNNAKNYFGL